jgi:hypothetical protein
LIERSPGRRTHGPIRRRQRVGGILTVKLLLSVGNVAASERSLRTLRELAMSSDERSAINSVISSSVFVFLVLVTH